MRLKRPIGQTIELVVFGGAVALGVVTTLAALADHLVRLWVWAVG
jgi:hypothetical protein